MFAKDDDEQVGCRFVCCASGWKVCLLNRVYISHKARLTFERYRSRTAA